MCASAMQNQAVQGGLLEAGFRIPQRHDFDERIAFPLQSLVFGRVGADGRREALEGQFGLVPNWVTDAKGGPKYGRYCYNARSESIFDKPSFREAILKRRGVLPVSAFFEFPDEEKPLRHRLRVEAEDGQPLWLAAIWERHAAYGLDSVSVVTCEPMELFKGLHSRSPVILDEGQLALWMDPQQQDAAAIGRMMKPRASKGLLLKQEDWGKPDPNLDLFGNE